MNRTCRLRVTIRGAVQGVGFRPFIYRLAGDLDLYGWVLNSSQGVFIEAEGEKPVLDCFLLRIQKEKPAPSFIQSLEASFLDVVGYTGFIIKHSQEKGNKSVLILPDVATCPACLEEISNPENRRYRYPFTNCTLCGPRFSIIQSIPYDRPQTTMAGFEMCQQCTTEYENPVDRRFHAQPNACPDCGPQLSAWDGSGTVLSERDDALKLGVERLLAGEIVALKGLGGYQLLVDASNTEALERLRRKKRRNEKPFALMMGNLDAVKRVCRLLPLEERLLLSPESPIVILDKRDSVAAISPSVAPGNPTLGVMLPYTPLHHILMADVGRPMVATSGNISDEPICIDEAEALEKLGDIADLFLVHDRPIARYVDDSVVRVVAGRELMIRRARGYAPMPVLMPSDRSGVLAVGAHQKNTVALQVNKNAFVSQHIGDLENEASIRSFHDAIDSLCRLYDKSPGLIVCDQHPGYLSTRYAESVGSQVIQVQHHYAHICACMAENQLKGPVLGVAWDGTGHGPDQTIWGGEFLLVERDSFERVAFLRPFRLPGGEKAIREPRRAALGLLFEMLGDAAFDQPLLKSFNEKELPVLKQILQKGIHSPVTSSMGRLFDAVAALINLRQSVSFEGQAAMELEFATHGFEGDEHYPIRVSQTIDWEPMVRQLLLDLESGTTTGLMALKFHNSLARMIVEVAQMVGVEKVALSGGCFQNRYLMEKAIELLASAGFKPYWHQRLPPNDGGISVGQLFAVSSSV